MAVALRNRSKFNHRAAAYHRITARFPDRFWLGLGAGHPEHTDRYVKLLAALNQYLDGLDDGLDAGGVPVAGRALAALGPTLLELTAERAGGAVPYLNLGRLGFTDEDLRGDGSNRLIDALVAHGDIEALARKLSAHLDAGADHVAIQLTGTEQCRIPTCPMSPSGSTGTRFWPATNLSPAHY